MRRCKHCSGTVKVLAVLAASRKGAVCGATMAVTLHGSAIVVGSCMPQNEGCSARSCAPKLAKSNGWSHWRAKRGHPGSMSNSPSPSEAQQK